MQTQSFRPPEGRLISVDALRGLTMFFIIGGERIFTSLYGIWPDSVTECLSRNMEHAGWQGFYFYDYVITGAVPALLLAALCLNELKEVFEGLPPLP